MLIKHPLRFLLIGSISMSALSVDINTLLDQAQEQSQQKNYLVNEVANRNYQKALEGYREGANEQYELSNKIMSRNFETQKVVNEKIHREAEKNRAEAKRKQEEHQQMLARNAEFEQRRRETLLREQELEQARLNSMPKIVTMTIDNTQKEQSQKLLVQQQLEAHRKAEQQKIMLTQQQAELKRREKEQEERKAYEDKMWRINAGASHCIGFAHSNFGTLLKNICSQPINVKYMFTKTKPFAGQYTTLRVGEKTFDGYKPQEEGYRYNACYFPAVPQTVNGGCI